MWQNFAVRNQRYRLVGERLFDMIKDPAQKNDISKENAGVVESMRKAYDDFWKSSGPHG